MKRLLFIILMSGFFTSYLMAQDIIVTNDGESLKVFNLDIGKKDIYYQLTNDEDAEVKRMPKSNVLIIRKADGTKIDPNATEQTKAPKPISRALRTYTKHKVQTAVATTGMQKKKKLSYFLAKTEDEQTFAFSILSETEKTVMVVEYEYEGSEIAIPEYVEFNGSRYTVTEIGEKAFSRLIISKISFPRTLKRIQKKGCFRVPLEKVILPFRNSFFSLSVHLEFQSLIIGSNSLLVYAKVLAIGFCYIFWQTRNISLIIATITL